MKNKKLLILGILLNTWGLILVTFWINKGWILDIYRLTLFEELLFIFKWSFHYTFFWLIWGLFFILVSFVRIEKRLMKLIYSSFLFVLCIQMIVYYVLPTIVSDQTSLVHNYPGGILINVFLLVYSLLLGKKVLLNAGNKGKDKIVLAVFLIIITFSLVKFCEIIPSIKNWRKAVQIQMQSKSSIVKREEILKTIGNPFLKFLVLNDSSNRKSLMILKGNKVIKVYSKSKRILNINNKNELNKAGMNVEQEYWIYSYSPNLANILNSIWIKKDNNASSPLF